MGAAATGGVDQSGSCDLLSSEGVMPADLATCVGVLQRLTAASGRLDLKCKALRELRKAAAPFVQAACQGSVAAHGASHGKDASAGTLSQQNKRKREQDLLIKQQCELRAGRLAALQSLESGEEERAKHRRIPDGPVDRPSQKGIDEIADDLHFSNSQRCYVCKCRYTRAHHFYADLCPPCAALNYDKRLACRDMAGRVCLVTGARVKVGFQTCLKLLRMGARVIATTRFPTDALKRYRAESDSAQWLSQLEVLGLDFRFVGAVEEFCTWLMGKEEHLDVVINNAAQTIRRPAAYYKHLVETERYQTAPTSQRTLPDAERCPEPMDDCGSHGLSSAVVVTSMLPSSSNAAGSGAAPLLSALQNWPGLFTSAEASQMIVLPEDKEEDEANFPASIYDAQGQQLDLRHKNTWKLRLEEVSSREALEVLLINVVAPFLLNSRLVPLLKRSPHPDRYIVNVSAMEGKFNRPKTPFHPHTNMAKAALNMMTRTCAADLAWNSSIFMTSVDTGWINEEAPRPEALRRAERGFQTPLDEIDAAARVLDPVLTGISSVASTEPPNKFRRNQGQQPDPSAGPVWGVFWKDYQQSEW